MLTEQDIYLFREGTHYRAYEKLGAHPTAAGAADEAGTEFSVWAPNARSVSVVGDFNHWDANATPLRKLSDGTWIIDVPIDPGRYAYAFVVDGKIEVDPSAPRADGEFGANSILMVRGS